MTWSEMVLSRELRNWGVGVLSTGEKQNVYTPHLLYFWGKCWNVTIEVLHRHFCQSLWYQICGFSEREREYHKYQPENYNLYFYERKQKKPISKVSMEETYISLSSIPKRVRYPSFQRRESVGNFSIWWFCFLNTNSQLPICLNSSVPFHTLLSCIWEHYKKLFLKFCVPMQNTIYSLILVSYYFLSEDVTQPRYILADSPAMRYAAKWTLVSLCSSHAFICILHQWLSLPLNCKLQEGRTLAFTGKAVWWSGEAPGLPQLIASSVSLLFWLAVWSRAIQLIFSTQFSHLWNKNSLLFL